MSAPTLSTQALRQALQQAWQARSPREKQGLALMALVVALASVWSLALAPAWTTWQQAPARQTELDQQTQQMRQLQTQAKHLQAPPASTRAEALKWLESSVADLGAGAHIQLQADRATLRVESAPADKMAHWLSQARERAQALPLQAQLQQVTAPPSQRASANTPTPPAPTSVHWRGSVVLRLPGTP